MYELTWLDTVIMALFFFTMYLIILGISFLLVPKKEVKVQ
jgi:hypothetical protein